MMEAVYIDLTHVVKVRKGIKQRALFQSQPK